MYNKNENSAMGKSEMTEDDYAVLRRKVTDELEGAYFAGGFGGALMESIEAETASDEELLRIARRNGIRL